jgi:hypothetical protein
MILTAVGTNPYAGNPIPGIILIAVVVGIVLFKRFTRDHPILIKTVLVLVGLWLLALVAPKALLWLQRRYDAVRDVVVSRKNARHRADTWKGI